MAALDPWSRAATGTEHAEQSALFMWCNTAAIFGVEAANNEACYAVEGFALRTYGVRSDQGALCEFAANNAIPELKRLYAIHNQGHGDQVRGARAKAEGVKRGVPDVKLPCPRMWPLKAPNEEWGEFFHYEDGHAFPYKLSAGLYIELKAKGTTKTGKRGKAIIDKREGETSADQDEWIGYLRGQGYAVAVCVGWEEARDVLLAYLGLTPS